jgi:hypothetical protein
MTAASTDFTDQTHLFRGELLGTTTTAVNSGLRRARAQLDRTLPAEDETIEPNDPVQRAILDRFTAAFENGDAAPESSWRGPPGRAVRSPGIMER